MRTITPPALVKAQQIAARFPSPVGTAFAAKREGPVARLYLYAPIGDYFEDGVSARDIVTALDANTEGATSLEVYVNSPGGVIGDGIAVYNAIRRFPGKKTCFVDGIAASIASIIALAGDRVVTNQGAVWMIHEPWSGILVYGTADQIEEAARKEAASLRKMREAGIDIYVGATGQSAEQISAWMAAETWMTPEDALARGFTDEVCKPEPMEPMEPEKPEKPEDRARSEFTPSPHTLAALARERFARARPGAQQPGQPGHTSTPGDRQKAQAS